MPAGCFEGTKLCQHGPAECEADSLEACAIDVYPSANVFAPFVTCFEGVHHANLSYVSLCAEEVGIPAAPILECYEDKARVAALDEKAARLTAQSGHQYTPWVVLSNFSGSEKQVLQDPDTLLASVCDIYAAQDGAKAIRGPPCRQTECRARLQLVDLAGGRDARRGHRRWPHRLGRHRRHRLLLLQEEASTCRPDHVEPVPPRGGSLSTHKNLTTRERDAV